MRRKTRDLVQEVCVRELIGDDFPEAVGDEYRGEASERQTLHA
jgi:hypothetical protein